MGKVVWLASYPKSGNTWVRVFLHNYITQAQTPHSVNALDEFSASENNAVFFNRYDARPASTFSSLQVQAMRARVHDDLTRLHDDLVFVKTHNARLAVHDIPLCTPAVTAGGIYIIRDPRDVAISYAAYLRLDLDRTIGFMGKAGAANRSTDEQVFEYLSSWSAHVDSWADAARTLVVRYEDLAHRPEATFAAMLRYLGDAAPDLARLRLAIAHSSFAELSAQERAHGYAAAGPAKLFFRKGTAGQWHEGLHAAQINRIEREHGGTMRRFGYLLA